MINLRIDKMCFYTPEHEKHTEGSHFGEAYFETAKPYDKAFRSELYGASQTNGYYLSIGTLEAFALVKETYQERLETIDIHEIFPAHWAPDFLWGGYATWIPQEWEQLIEDNLWLPL